MSYIVIFVLMTLGSVAMVGGGVYYFLTYGNVIDLEIHV